MTHVSLLSPSRQPQHNTVLNSREVDQRRIAKTSEKLAKSLPGPLVKLSNFSRETTKGQTNYCSDRQKDNSKTICFCVGYSRISAQVSYCVCSWQTKVGCTRRAKTSQDSVGRLRALPTTSPARKMGSLKYESIALFNSRLEKLRSSAKRMSLWKRTVEKLLKVEEQADRGLSANSHVGSSQQGAVERTTHCEGVGGVQGALTLFCGGVAKAFHDDRVVELKNSSLWRK